MEYRTCVSLILQVQHQFRFVLIPTNPNVSRGLVLERELWNRPWERLCIIVSNNTNKKRPYLVDVPLKTLEDLKLFPLRQGDHRLEAASPEYSRCKEWRILAARTVQETRERKDPESLPKRGSKRIEKFAP